MKRFLMVLSAFATGAALAGCGATMPTTPLAACPAIAANFKYADTTFFPQGYTADGVTMPRTIFTIQDVFACGGVTVTKRHSATAD